MKSQTCFKIMFFALFLPFFGFGQVKAKINLEEIRRKFVKENNIVKRKELAKLFLNEAKTSKRPILIAQGFYLHSQIYFETNPTKSIVYYDSIIKCTVDTKDAYFPAVAFCEKARLLIDQNKYSEGLKNYSLAEFYSKKNNIDYYYNVRIDIGIIKSENLGEIRESLKLYKECYSFYKTKNINEHKYSEYYLCALFGIADDYKALNQIDSCSYYNKLGFQESKKLKNENYKYMFSLNEGANQITNKNYKVAKDSISKALPKMIKYNNNINVLASYYYLGIVNEKLKNYPEAVKNYLKVDSVFKTSKIITPEFTSGYSFLINYYKKKHDANNQLLYVTKLMTIDSILNIKYKNLEKSFQKNYDIPHLISEKEYLINSLENKNLISFLGIGFLIVIIVILFLFVKKQKRQQKLNQLRFEEIIYKLNVEKSNNETEIITTQVDYNIPEKETTQKTIEISQEITNEILALLLKFESSQQFLESNITAQMLANQFKTNIKYLSKIVNEYKNKPFIQYVNDLRIDYALKELEKDKRLRNYTINALANEFGFNSAESFNSAFYKKTEIKATFYIKELESLKNN